MLDRTEADTRPGATVRSRFVVVVVEERSDGGFVSAKCLPKLESRVWVALATRDVPMADGLLEAVRGLWLADPELGPKPLLAKLREQQPDLGAGTREVREALT
eukprot:scaffold95962_cov49-Phaeocystis_antarctica.AAC.3